MATMGERWRICPVLASASCWLCGCVNLSVAPQPARSRFLPSGCQSWSTPTHVSRIASVRPCLLSAWRPVPRSVPGWPPNSACRSGPPGTSRALRTVACAPPTSVRILGIDDWAWKKGQIYGTLLVDLELRKPIEILPDRREETVRVWLLAHPEIEVVSRDRGGEYAAAAKKGAPQAQQIADKFHLLLNLREKLKELMARKQKLLPQVETICSRTRTSTEPGESSGGAPAAAASAVEASPSFRHISPYPRASSCGSVPIPAEETPSQISRANRHARYEAVRTLHQQLVSQREIARRLKLSRNTVRKFLQVETFPERSPRPYRGSILDPYKPYILDRWKAGCWNGMQLLEEIQHLGYTGSPALLRYFLTRVRKQHRAAGTTLALELSPDQGSVSTAADLSPKPSPKRRMSPSRASWLCMCQPDKLDEPQRKLVEQLRAAHPDLATAYRLSQAFVSMLAERRAQDLDDWLLQAKQSGIRELKSFAQGIRRDYAAVKAAFSSHWSNGQVEAQVNWRTAAKTADVRSRQF